MNKLYCDGTKDVPESSDVLYSISKITVRQFSLFSSASTPSTCFKSHMTSSQPLPSGFSICQWPQRQAHDKQTLFERAICLSRQRGVSQSA